MDDEKVKPDHLVLWAGGTAADTVGSAADRLANVTLDFVVGNQDQFKQPEAAARQMEAIRLIKPAAHLWTFSGDHRMDASTLAAIVASWE